MDMGLNGARVLVTAGANGIGLAIARAFHREGASVFICDVDEKALAERAKSEPHLKSIAADVSDRGDVKRLFDTAIPALGGLDCLVNNAGIAGPTGRVEDINPEDWDRCLTVCLTSQFNCARVAIPHLRKSSNGSIMNVSSLAGKYGFALRSPYAAAKWGVIGFTKSLSIELGDDNIRVNALLPGIVAGDRQRRVLEAKAQARGMSFADIERIAFAGTSIKAYVEPEELADLCVFTASPRAKTISGQALSVCGDTQVLS